MTKTEALRECEELWRLVGEWPHADTAAIGRAEEFERQLDWDRNSTRYIREKATNVTSMFRYWFTQKRWRRYGDDPSHLRSIVLGAVSKLKKAIESEYPDEEP